MNVIFKIFMTTLFFLTFTNNVNAKEMSTNVGVLFYDLKNDPFMNTLKEEIEKIFPTFTNVEIFSANNSQSNQMLQLEILIQKKVDFILVNVVEPIRAPNIIKVSQKSNIPIVFFNREPDLDILKEKNIYFVGTNKDQAGVLQGEIIKKLWDLGIYDLNNDDKFQYVMLTGNVDNAEAIARTRFSLINANELGVSMEQIGRNLVANWDRKLAADSFENLFLLNQDKIEIIISNNDSMALGAIDVLKKYGYNNGKGKFIPVIGVDAIQEALLAIENGQMSATVKQDAKSMASILAKITKNFLEKKDILEDLKIKPQDNSIDIRIDYQIK